MKNNIKIYGVKDSYIKYLSQYQEHLFLHEGGSFGRKYIGTVLEINEFFYFAPLSSFKFKHKKMKESVDFIKIKDYAVININNMIPVPKEQLIELDINAEKDSHYKFAPIGHDSKFGSHSWLCRSFSLLVHLLPTKFNLLIIKGINLRAKQQNIHAKINPEHRQHNRCQ